MPYRNIHSLNTLLSRITTVDQLRDAYDEHCKNPKMTLDDQGNRYDPMFRYYCSGAVNFVCGFLVGDNRVCRESDKHLKVLDRQNAPALLKAIKDSAKAKGSAHGWLIFLNSKGEGAHNCIIAHTGSQWGFFQANRTNGVDDYTLVPALNAGRRNWCLNDMSEKQFDKLFVGLTQAHHSSRLFPYQTPPTSWALAVYGFNGQWLI